MDLKLHYDFVNDKSLAARVGPTLTCTRSGSSATVVNSSGLIETVGANTARFQHDSSGNSLGLLVEEARTNLLVYSEQFDNAAWGKGAVTVDANAATGPDGGTTMDRINVNATNASHQLFDAVTISANTDYALSAFFRDDGAGFAGLVLGNSDTDHATVIANLSTGEIADTSTGSNSGTIAASGVDDYGNGIYRVWMVASIDETSSFFKIAVAESASPSYVSGSPVYTATAGADVFVWGAQLEEGAFLTSYIPTTTASVTRNADDQIESDDVSWYTADSPGTLYLDVERIYTTEQANVRPFDLANGTSSELYVVAVSNPEFWRHGVGGQLIDSTGITSTVGVRDRIAFGFGTADAAVYINGSLGGTDTSGALPSTATQFHVGSRANTTGELNGLIKEIIYYDERRLTNAELSNMSNGYFPLPPSGSKSKGRSSRKSANPRKGPMRLRILLRDGEQLKIK